MTDQHQVTSTATDRYLPALLFLFVGSGCAALIYEVVWLQLLSLIIGSSAISLGVLLGTFMGGMCLGSYFLPRYIDVRHHPLRVYAFLELGIGVMGLLLLFGTPVIEFVYTSVGGGSIWVRAVVAGVCLLPPTMMMGATLPAVARFVKTTPEGVSWMGFFYGGNIGGAVVGALAAGFLLLRLFDMTVATFVAAFLNVIVSLFALMLAGAASYEPVETTDDETIKRSAGARTVYLVIAMSGMTALAAQVLWTRQLSLLFGATTYTFSLILGVFLVGLGIGSSVGAAMSRGRINPRVGSTSSSIWCGASGSSYRARFCGVRVSRWRWRPSRRPARIRVGSWAASTRPTRSGPSWDRWGRGSCWSCGRGPRRPRVC
jgi:spermidine synthase